MRQVMPHRNNISVRRTKCKTFLRRLAANVRVCDDFGQQRR